MFRALNRQAPSESGGESEDESVSVTSTISNQYDPDQEFVVKGILAERYDDECGLQYLIEWENFDIHESTWEPVNGINDQLTQIWEETKEKQDSGEIEPFDVDGWRHLVEQVRAAKIDRHFRRNKKRKRLGLPETEPIQAEPIRMKRTPSRSENLGDPTAAMANESESSDSEAEVWDEPLIESTEKRNAEAAVQATDTGALPPLKTSSTGGTGAASQPAQGSSGTTSQSPSASKAPTAARPTSPRRETKAQATTGYQGTARKPVIKPAPAKNAVPSGASTTARNPPGPSAPRPRIPAALNTKATGSGKGGLTAKRTKAAPRTGNIFTSGKVRKIKPGFKEVLNDTNQAPRMFSNHHIRRAAEKKALEERAPDPTNLPMFNLTNGLPPRNNSTSSATLEEISPITPPTEVMGSLHHPQAVPEAQPARNGPSPQLGHGPTSILGTGLAPGQASGPPFAAPLKSALKSRSSLGEQTATKKTVVFADQKDDDGELFVSTTITDSPEPMDSEPSENLEPPVGRVLRSPPLPQTTWKKLVLGQHNASIKAFFTGLPPIPEHISILWRNALFGPDLETLRFRHMCLAQTVKIKIQAMAVGNGAAGYLETQDGDGPSVVALARFLSIGSLGLYYSHPMFNLLVYPAQCEEWKVFMGVQGEASDTDPLLRFWISDADFDFTSIMRPWDLNVVQSPTWRSKEYPNSNNQEMVSLMQRWFGFEYEKLLPVRKTTASCPDSFFLAFPSSKSAHTQAISFWLRSCNPQCRLFFGIKPGSWEAFTSTLKQDRSAGVVIVHESLALTLRRFPKLYEGLQRMDNQYWCFSDPNSPRPLYPSMVPEEQPPRAPVTPGFIRLFPNRTSILLTPSFIVSEPRSTRRFLDWFLSNPARDFGLRLVAGWDLHQYLSELANEKADAYHEMRLSNYSDVDLEIRSRGLSGEQCNDRFIASIKALELHNLRLRRIGPSEADEEDNSAVIYAPPFIDPNDEQSLVNWFGWWSLQRADQFRQFWVLGTDDQRSNARMFERRIEIPKYTRVTINDPDVVLETIQQHHENASAQQSEAWTATAPGSRPPAVDLEYLSPKSAVLRNDGAAEFREALVDLEAQYYQAGYCPWILFNQPVSWDGPDMVNHFIDLKEEYNRISTWWNFVRPFPQRGAKNTYIGFFYTIDEEWNPETTPKGPKPKRHPWIAVYRPVNLFKRPWDRCEVIIWDPCARTKFPGRRQVGENELSYMQRRVIEYVRQHSPEKNPGTWVDQVWLGGFGSFTGEDSPFPIDRAFSWLNEAFKDIKHHLPAPEQSMMSRGYLPVVPDTAVPPTAGPVPTGQRLLHDLGDAPMDLDSSDRGSEDDDDKDDEDDARMIFHPPRRTKFLSGQRTKCTNNLYEMARLARSRNEGDNKMVYSFPSTRNWYEKQVAEGRDFQHITVESNFDRFLNHFYPKGNSVNSSINAGPRVSD